MGGGGSSVKTYVAVGEVTTLEHELGDDTVEDRALVAEALLAGAESTEVLGSVGSDIAAQLHDNAASGLCRKLALGLWCWEGKN